MGTEWGRETQFGDRQAVRNQVAQLNTQREITRATYSGADSRMVRRSADTGSFNAWAAGQRDELLWAPGNGKRRSMR